jgi:hypothetical protein
LSRGFAALGEVSPVTFLSRLYEVNSGREHVLYARIVSFPVETTEPFVQILGVGVLEVGWCSNPESSKIFSVGRSDVRNAL